MKSFRFHWVQLSILLASWFGAGVAFAFPGYFVGDSQEARLGHAAQVLILKHDKVNVVSFMLDYEGPMKRFALISVVPGDVKLSDVSTLKREYMDRVEQMTAPRFHEFWEMDPCESGDAQQEWERDLSVSGPGMLGGGTPTGKLAKELFLDTGAKKKEGEYNFSLLAPGKLPGAWLTAHGYEQHKGGDAALRPYLSSGYRVLIAEVDTKRVELLGDESVQLSPIRYVTRSQVDEIPSRLGLIASPGQQELLVYVLDATKRFEVANYRNTYPPTNIPLDFKVKERIGEFYAGVHDGLLKRHPGTFLVEYIWSTKGCGKPCPSAPLDIEELMTLGGEVLEQWVPKEERDPKPEELSDEEKEAEKAKLAAAPATDRKALAAKLNDDRALIAKNRALQARHVYTLTRLHYRYDSETLTADPRLVAREGGVRGGVGVPKGQEMKVSMSVEEAPTSGLQTRYNNFHPWKGMQKCDDPQRGRWGKAPRTYRGLRKVWVAQDLTRKKRDLFKLNEVALAAIPALDVAPKMLAPAPVETVAAVPELSTEKDACGCSLPGRALGGTLTVPGFGLLGLALWLRRRKFSISRG